MSSFSFDPLKEYETLSTLREALVGVPLLAVTATASPAVLADVQSTLGLEDATVFESPVDRENLYLSMHQKGPLLKADLEKAFGSLFDGPREASAMDASRVVVFVPTRLDAETLADACNRLPCAEGARTGASPFAAPYHAGLPEDVKAATHSAFTKGEVRVICATIAFAMGVNVPAVRRVIHWGVPKSPEA